MEHTFHDKVRTAAAAAWWTFLAGAAFLVAQWVAFLLVISTKPDWVLAMWAPDTSWADVRTVWFGALAFLKLCLWPLALLALWLTLWARHLARGGTRS